MRVLLPNYASIEVTPASLFTSKLIESLFYSNNFSDGYKYEQVNADNVANVVDPSVRSYIMIHGFTDSVDVNSNGEQFLYFFVVVIVVFISSLLQLKNIFWIYPYRLDDQNGQTDQCKPTIEHHFSGLWFVIQM